MYHYSALGPEGSAFRLLRVLKGSGPELQCELSPQSLQNAHPPYEALSYTWGSSELVECIKLDRKPFWVTDNLHSALQSLRLCDRDRILWIDAICINQEDKVEQSQQVQQMGQIYEKAEKVLFWLGKATPQIMALMETLNQFRNTDPDSYYNPETFKDWNWKDHSIGIKQLLNREWFTRVWILQEAAKARRADVCCGVRSIPTEIFVLALSFVEQKLPPHCKPVLDIMAEPLRSNSWWAQTSDLRTLLRKFQGSKATDERDKIYALLGLSSDPLDTKNITIDYQRPTSQIVHEAVTYLLQSTQTNQSTPFTIHDVLDLMCSFTTLDVTYFVPAQGISSEATGFHPPSVYQMSEPNQFDAKFSAAVVLNDPTLLLVEERPADSFESQKTCYSQIVRLMPDQQATRASQKYENGLHILSWGYAGNHVKVVVVRDRRKAILEAATRGYDEVVRRLLHTKLGIKGEEECEGLVLNDIVEKGTAELLQFMLDVGADFNAQCGVFGSALQTATCKGKKEMVKILLNAGADFNAQGGVFGSALQTAAYFSRTEIVKILLNVGADVNVQGGESGSALQLAIRPGKEETVKILLDAGADINAQGGKYGNALQAAAYYGEERIVEILLNAGADVNAQGGRYGNALRAAAIRGERRIVKRLLDAGANTNA